MPDTRFSWAVIMDLLDVLEHAGYKRGDDIHTGRAIALMWDAARIYAGELDEPEAVPAVRLVVCGLAKAEAARAAAVIPPGEPAAIQQLAEIRLVPDAFCWETDDRQYALEQIDGIVNGDGQAAPDPADDLLTAAERMRDEALDEARELRALAAEILAAHRAATAFDRTPEVEARLAG
jgi:hypothetical protein